MRFLGLPNAIAHSPTLTLSESPKLQYLKFCPSIFNKAISVTVSNPTISASYASPPGITTLTLISVVITVGCLKLSRIL